MRCIKQAIPAFFAFPFRSDKAVKLFSPPRLDIKRGQIPHTNCLGRMIGEFQRTLRSGRPFRRSGDQCQALCRAMDRSSAAIAKRCRQTLTLRRLLSICGPCPRFEQGHPMRRGGPRKEADGTPSDAKGCGPCPPLNGEHALCGLLPFDGATCCAWQISPDFRPGFPVMYLKEARNLHGYQSSQPSRCEEAHPQDLR